MDGFGLIKNRIEAKKKLDEAGEIDYGGYRPAKLMMDGSLSTLDRFIADRMGGKRDGLTIVWTICGNKYTFDPYTGAVTSAHNGEK